MKDQIFILSGHLALADSKPDDDGFEKLVVTGSWKGHWQGEFEITEAMLQQMAHFGNTRDVATVVDYGHASTFDSAAPAAGWIDPGGFAVRDKSLWGKIKWNTAARVRIDADELRYKSPTVVFNTRDRVSGKVGGASLHSVALTNTPFMTELDRVRLNSILGALNDAQGLTIWSSMEEEIMTPEQLKELVKILSLGADATVEQILAAAEQRRKTVEHFTQIATMLQITAADKVADAVRALQTQATAGQGQTERIVVLETEVAATREEKRKAAALALVRQAQSERKVSGDETANFKAALQQAEKDPEGFKALMASMPPWVAGGEPARLSPDHQQIKPLDEITTKYAAQLGLTDEDIKTLAPRQ